MTMPNPLFYSQDGIEPNEDDYESDEDYCECDHSMDYTESSDDCYSSTTYWEPYIPCEYEIWHRRYGDDSDD